MTNEKINRTIHEKVMGAKWYGFGGALLTKNPHLKNLRMLRLEDEWSRAMVEKGNLIPAVGTEEIDSESSDDLNYCESIADAFKVVEKLEADNWGWNFDCDPKKINRYDVRLFWFDSDVLEKKAIAHAESLPKAICLAAIKAIES